MKNRLFTLALAIGCILFVSPKTANSGVTCGEIISDHHSVTQCRESASVVEEEETEFAPLTSIIPGVSLLFQ